MGKDIVIRGVTRQGIETFSAPISGGGTAVYRDTSGADALPGDLTAGKIAFGPDGQIIGTKQPPSGSISITENGSVDVTDYATALVNVQSGGGGPTAADAILLVTVPAGSTVTAEKGGVTLVPTLWTAAADSSLEKALFVIEPEQFDSSTPWTVTAANGTDSASDSVIISANNAYEINIVYGLYFYKDGESFNGFVVSSTKANNRFTITENASTIGLKATNTGRNGVAWALAFSNNGYSKLNAVIESGSILTTNIPYFGIYRGSGNVYDEANLTAKTAIDTALPTTVSVDVSGITSGYIAFRLHQNSEIQVKAIYLSD